MEPHGAPGLSLAPIPASASLGAAPALCSSPWPGSVEHRGRDSKFSLMKRLYFLFQALAASTDGSCPASFPTFCFALSPAPSCLRAG